MTPLKKLLEAMGFISKKEEAEKDEKGYRQLMQDIKILQMKLKNVAHHSGFAQSLSPFKGRGMEFYETRPYVESDDVKSIDWNVTARLNKAYVKVYQEEHELNIMVAIDLTASQEMASRKESKKTASLKIGASIALSAMSNGNKVSCLFFDDEVIEHFRPFKNKSNLPIFMRKAFFYEPKKKKSNLEKPINEINKALKKRNIIFLISDFLDNEKWKKALFNLSAKHDVYVIQIFDPLEKAFPKSGLVRIENAETGFSKLVDTSTVKFQQQYQTLFQKHLEETRTTFRRLNLHHLCIDTTTNFFVQLDRFLKKQTFS